MTQKQKTQTRLISLICLIACLALLLHTESQAQQHISLVLEDSILESSPGGELSIKGEGFITNMPHIYQAKIISKNGKVHKLKAKSSSATELRFQLPHKLSYGDYKVKLRFRSRLLRSKTSIKDLKLRPKAPDDIKFKHQSISEIQELEQILDEQNLILDMPEQLQLGANQISSYYYQDGYKSLVNNGNTIYYLPQTEILPQLKIHNKQILAKTLNNQEIDISAAAKHEALKDGLSSVYYTSTPLRERYLETLITLSPLVITQVHVTSPESATIVNRSSYAYDLSDCYLSDSISRRFVFADDYPGELILSAKKSVTINDTLGLNDSSPDSLSITCGDKLIDSFSYSELDDSGYAVPK